MAKPKQDEIDEQLKKQDDDVYGTGYTDGDPDNFADTKDMVTAVTGNDPDPEQDGFSMAEEVDKDEQAIQEKPIDGYQSESSEE